MKINKLNKYILCDTEEFYDKYSSKSFGLKPAKLTDKEAIVFNYALSLNGSKKKYIKIF